MLKKSRWGLKHPQRLVFTLLFQELSMVRRLLDILSINNESSPSGADIGLYATDYGSSPSPDRSPGPAHYYWTGHSTANIRYRVAAVSHLLHLGHAGPDSSSRPALPSRQDRLSLPHERPKRRGDISQSPGNFCFIKCRQHHIAKRTWIIQQYKRDRLTFLPIRIPLRSTSVLARYAGSMP
ncbi:Uncharacterised protein [Escherichia coli]|uniref:Uncharacterized protein n=1 Tax=Escherichia coli TaxID=562 RepID=A0A377BUA5_ECOLX|nr:Uncharacterised protein [Escherichia coli]